MITPEAGFPESELPSADPSQPSAPAPDHELEPVAADPDALARPEEEVADAGRDDRPPREPAAGGGAGGEPAQGEGAPDSW